MPIPETLTPVPDTEDGALQVTHFRRGGIPWTRVSLRVRDSEGNERPALSREWPRNDVLGGLSPAEHNGFLVAQRAALIAALGGTDS